MKLREFFSKAEGPVARIANWEAVRSLLWTSLSAVSTWIASFVPLLAEQGIVAMLLVGVAMTALMVIAYNLTIWTKEHISSNRHTNTTQAAEQGLPSTISRDHPATVGSIDLGSSRTEDHKGNAVNLPSDEKARIRLIINDLAQLFETNVGPTMRQCQQLLDEIGDFQNPSEPIDPAKLKDDVESIARSIEGPRRALFREFLSSHPLDRAEIALIIGNGDDMYHMQQAALSLLGGINTVLVIVSKCCADNISNYALGLLLEKWKYFKSNVEQYQGWIDECSQKIIDRRRELLY